jgi:hypothetical protein
VDPEDDPEEPAPPVEDPEDELLPLDEVAPVGPEPASWGPAGEDEQAATNAATVAQAAGLE